MKIVSLTGSFRPNGNTALIVKLLEEKLTELAYCRHISLKIESVSLSEKDIRPCRGCRVCFDKGEGSCPAKDDFLTVRDRIAEADGLILASPVYVEDVSGTMKNWIDRMAFNSHRPALFGKYAAVITTSGAGSSRHSLQTMTNALTAWGCRIVSRNKFKMGARMEEEQARQLFGRDIEKTANRLLKSISGSATSQPSFHSLVAFQVQKKLYSSKINEPSADIAYWKANGWLEPARWYYTSAKPNPVKTAAARIIAALVIRYVLT